MVSNHWHQGQPHFDRLKGLFRYGRPIHQVPMIIELQRMFASLLERRDTYILSSPPSGHGGNCSLIRCIDLPDEFKSGYLVQAIHDLAICSSTPPQLQGLRSATISLSTEGQDFEVEGFGVPLGDWRGEAIYQRVGAHYNYLCSFTGRIKKSRMLMIPYHQAIIASSMDLEGPPLTIEIRSSGMQQIADYEANIGVDLLRNVHDNGIKFLIDGFECFIIMVQDHIRFIVNVGGALKGIRLPLRSIINSQGKITESSLRTYMKRIHRLYRDNYQDMVGFTATHDNDLVRHTGIDCYVAPGEDRESWIRYNSVTNAHLLAMNLNCYEGFLTELVPDTALTEDIVGEDGVRQLRVAIDEDVFSLVITCFKAMVMLRTPQFVEVVKRDTESARKDRNPNRRPPRRTRVWGSNLIRYIYPPNHNESKGRRHHFVMGHNRRLPDGRITTVRPHYRGLPSLGTSATILAIGRSAAGGQSRIALEWLRHIEETEGITLRHAESGGEFRISCGDTYYFADGYHEETGTIYEFHGDYWHGNPAIYEAEDFNDRAGRTMGELYDATMEREQRLRDIGFNVVSIWESDWLSRLSMV